MSNRLPQDFYRPNSLEVARALIGKYLVRRTANGPIVGRIVETEAYHGPHDLGSHASRGRTKRTDVMFGPPGYWYVYVIYGMYHCLNVVTEEEDYPAAILIRAVTPVSGVPRGVKTDGPGKLCRAFDIDRRLNRTRAFGRGIDLWIEDRGDVVPSERILATPRINIDYAGEYKDKPWRFVVRD